MREIVLDTETTGLDPARGHRVVEIGCVELVNHIPSGRNWHCHVNPQRDMPAEAEAVHGLSTQFLSDKPLFADLAGDFLEFIADSRLIIHNAAFDAAFLNWELKQIGQVLLEPANIVDTLALARRRFPAGPNSLDALCKRFGIDNSARTTHSALLDAELLAEVYLELIGGRQANLGLGRGRGGRAAQLPGRARSAPRREPLAPLLSKDETNAHAEAIARLGKEAVWTRYAK